MIVRKQNPHKLPEMTEEVSYKVKTKKSGGGMGLKSESQSALSSSRQQDVRVRPVTAGINATKK